MAATGIEPTATEFIKEHSDIERNCVVGTYLNGAFDSIFLSCHLRVSEWIHTLYLPECQRTPCSKKGQNLKFKWQ